MFENRDESLPKQMGYMDSPLYSPRKKKTIWNQNFGSVPSSDNADAKYYHNVLKVVFPSYLLNFCTRNHLSSI